MALENFCAWLWSALTGPTADGNHGIWHAERRAIDLAEGPLEELGRSA